MSAQLSFLSVPARLAMRFLFGSSSVWRMLAVLFAFVVATFALTPIASSAVIYLSSEDLQGPIVSFILSLAYELSSQGIILIALIAWRLRFGWNTFYGREAASLPVSAHEMRFGFLTCLLIATALVSLLDNLFTPFYMAIWREFYWGFIFTSNFTYAYLADSFDVPIGMIILIELGTQAFHAALLFLQVGVGLVFVKRFKSGTIGLTLVFLARWALSYFYVTERFVLGVNGDRGTLWRGVETFDDQVMLVDCVLLVVAFLFLFEIRKAIGPKEISETPI